MFLPFFINDNGFSFQNPHKITFIPVVMHAHGLIGTDTCQLLIMPRILCIRGYMASLWVIITVQSNDPDIRVSPFLISLSQIVKASGNRGCTSSTLANTCIRSYVNLSG
jgi:hypothetical protein